jgi:hypothetical protein
VREGRIASRCERWGKDQEKRGLFFFFLLESSPVVDVSMHMDALNTLFISYYAKVDEVET